MGTVLKPAGLEYSTGLITTQYMKDPGDKQWDNDPEMLAYKAFMKKYFPDGDVNDQLNLTAYSSANAMVHVLKQAGDTLTRDNLMKIAGNLKATVIIQHDQRDIAKLPAFPNAAR